MARLEELLIAADNPIGKAQRRPIFRRKRAGEVLTREQVKAIKLGRKMLRAEMKDQGLKEKSDFELTASSMGLYFDKSRLLGFLLWLRRGCGLWALLAPLGLLMLAMFAYSAITQLQGHFTINLTDGMFKEGFVLSDGVEFKAPSTHLFAMPAENVPCISITHLPEDLDEIDGQHNDDYFAYTFYCRNEGDTTVGYEWQVNLNSESQNLSDACWVMIFEDGEMLFYAEPNAITGESEMLPAKHDNTRGYIQRPLEQFNKSPKEQYQVIKEGEDFDYNRVLPIPFESESVITSGHQPEVAPGETHKYTVIIWLEGDDPDCTDDMIGGHVGMDFQFRMDTEDAYMGEGGSLSGWAQFWENLKFWEE